MIKGTWLPIGSQILDSTNGRPASTSLIERPPIHWLLTSEAKPTDYSIVSNSWRFHPKSVVLIAVALALRWPSGWLVAVEHNEGRALPAQFGPARWPGRWRVGPIIVVLYQLFPLTAGLLSRLPGREHYSFISFWWHDAQWQQINHGIFENKMMSGYFFCRNNMKKQFPWGLGCKRNAHKIYGLKTLDCEQVCTSSRPCIGIKSIYPTIVKNANTLRRLFSL